LLAQKAIDYVDLLGILKMTRTLYTCQFLRLQLYRGRAREVTSVNDDSVEQAAQALPAQLLKEHRCIEDDSVDSLRNKATSGIN